MSLFDFHIKVIDFSYKVSFPTKMFLELVAVVCFVWSATGTPIGGRIVNGTNADEGEIPYIVSLRINGRHTCGGSIIDATHILTAAHCTTYDASYYSIQYGVTHITSGSDAPNVIQVVRKSPHESYVAGKGYVNDVSVLELAEPIPFGPTVQPVQLPQPFEATPENSLALLSGWGYPYTGGSVVEDLQKVNINIYPDADCERIHAQTGPTSRNYHVCAGIPEGGKGQCSGDSGGPLVVDGVQVGVVSWSVKPCTIQGYPGVFAKVASYVPWIYTKVASK